MERWPAPQGLCIVRTQRRSNPSTLFIGAWFQINLFLDQSGFARQGLGIPRAMQGHLGEVAQVWREVLSGRCHQVQESAPVLEEMHGDSVWTLGTSGQTVGVGAEHGQSLELAASSKRLPLGWQGRDHLPEPRWAGAEHLES